MNKFLHIFRFLFSFWGVVFGWDFFGKTSLNPSQGGRLALVSGQDSKKVSKPSPSLEGARGGLFYVLLTAICLLSVLPLLGQGGTFPVQVIPQVTPPPPIYFADYADVGTVSSPLRVQIILNDFEIANREIRLRTYFEGGGIAFQSNDVVVGASQLFLEGGLPLVLTNVELAPYFRFENINGISPNVYGQAIPEDAYTFCFEVYDVLTGSRISQRSCATSVVFQNEPPFLISPRNKTNVQEINPQNILFQWTPRHINVTNVEYELSIVEIWDTQVDPQQAFLSSPPVFQTTTTATTYVYGPADPLFLSGKNYAWRVQAKAKQGIEEIGLFENQGYSEIFSFSYAGSCDLPIGIDHEVKGSTNANIFWDDFSTDVPEYNVRYRKKAPSNSPSGGGNEWFSNKTTTNQTTLWGLTAGATYEYQIQKKCTITTSDWSNAKQFTTFIADDEASVYECGITPDFNLSSKDPLPNIGSGDQFTAGDFPVTILEVNGGNGRFTGKGYVTIPYLNSIKVGVEFTNVLINTDNRLAEGTVTTMYDPNLQNILDVDDAIDTVEDVVDSTGEFFEGDNDLDEITVDWEITKEDITVENGMVVITNPYNGVTTTEPLGDDMTVVDSAGNTYYVDADGNVTEGGQINQGDVVNADNVDGVSNNGQVEELTAKGIKVTFTEKGTYGIDIMPNTANSKLKNEYTIIKDADGEDYPLVHHAVAKGGYTQLKATIDIESGSAYTADDVTFKNKQGQKITANIQGNTATLTLNGTYSFENETIYATVPDPEDNTKELTAGAFTLWHLTEKSINVVLVSVNGGQLGKVEAEVNTIFEQGVAQINFGNSINLTIDENVFGSNGLDVGESAWTKAYNEEQKEFIRSAKGVGATDSDTYYLLVCGTGISNSKGIAGFMPLQRQFGFVFQKYVSNGDEAKGNVAKTLAHEIGHGVFALQHPFSQYGMPEERTEWLMDYSDGSVLPHMHWAQMHDPAIKFYVFQDEEEGQSTKIGDIPLEFKNTDGTFTFMTLNGSYITLPSEVKDLVFVTGLDELEPYIKYPTGALIRFSIKNEVFRVKTSGHKSPSGTYSNKDFVFNYEGFESITTKDPYNKENRKDYSNAIITFSPRYGNRLLARTLVPNLPFNDTDQVNILNKERNDKYAKIYEGRLLASKTYKYQESSPYDAGYIVNEELVGHILGEGIDWNFSYPIISKIAMLNNSYPDAVKRLFPYLPLEDDAEHGSWIYSDLAHIPLKTKKSQELSKIYLKLLNAITADIDDCTTTFENLSNASSAVKVENCINALSDDELKDISVNKKILAISLMLDKWRLEDKQEIGLIRLLKFTEKKDIDKLLKNLNSVSKVEGVNYNLLRKLVYKTDNDHTYFHEDNYRQLVSILATLCVGSSSTFSDELSTLNIEELLERNIKFYYRSFWDNILADLQLTWNFLNDQDLFTYDTKTFWQQENEADAHIKMFTEQYIGSKVISETEPLNLHPYSPIFFTNKSGLSMLNDYNKDAPVLSPAILAFYADDVSDTKTIVDGIQATVDLVSLASGYGILAKAPSIARKTFIIADMAGSGISLSTNIVGYENFSPEARGFIDALNILTSTVAVTDIASSLKNVKNIFRQLNNLEQSLPSKAQTENFLDALIAAKGKLNAVNDNTDKIREARIWLAHLEMETSLGNIDNLKVKINQAKKVLEELIINRNDVFKLNNKASSLTESQFSNLKNQLSDQGYIRFDYDNPDAVLGDWDARNPLDFLNDTDDKLYDLFLANNYYVKYDASDGRILLADVDGNYYGFAQYSKFKEIPEAKLEAEIYLIADKLKDLVGLNGKRKINIPWFGEIDCNPNITTTAIGRMNEINRLKAAFGDFKNIDLGEVPGGLNILNRPDTYYYGGLLGTKEIPDVVKAWLVNYNLPWMRRAAERGDDIYLISDPSNLSNILIGVDKNGFQYATITAYELRVLREYGAKPRNISNVKWVEIVKEINSMEKKGLFKVD